MIDFKKLEVWKESHHLIKELYKLCDKFDKVEKYRLVDQLLRAGLSIPTNIAEGSTASSQKLFARYISISLGSATEVEYLLLASFELNYLTEFEYSKFNSAINVIKRKLINLLKKLNA